VLALANPISIPVSIIVSGTGVETTDTGHVRWLGADGKEVENVAVFSDVRALAHSTFPDGANWLVANAMAAFADTGDDWHTVTLPNGHPTAIAAIDASHALVAMWDALYIAGKDGHATEAGSAGDRVSAIAADGDGGAWLLTDHGLGHWTPDHWSVEKTTFKVIARGPLGLIGATDRELVSGDWHMPIGRDGARTLAISSRDGKVAVLSADEDGWMIYFATVGAATVSYARVELPRWWREVHEDARQTDAAIAIVDGGAVVAAPDVALYGKGGHWRELALTATPELVATDDSGDDRALISVSGAAGYARRGGENGAVFSLRSETVMLQRIERPAIGIGGFLELGGTTIGDRWAGGGLSIVRYGRSGMLDDHPHAVAVSAGGVFAWGNESGFQPELSVFAGLRSHHRTSDVDRPIGVRVDARLGNHGDASTLTVSLATDFYGFFTTD
jgi:hypothetical protein